MSTTTMPPPNTVFIRAGEIFHDVWFQYDEKVVGLIKTLPAGQRSWDPDSKHWLVHPFQVATLVGLLRAYDYVVQEIPSETRARADESDYRDERYKEQREQEERRRRAREEARQRNRQQREYEDFHSQWREEWEGTQREHRRQQAPRNSTPSGDWAGVLFAAVGPERHDAVFKALTKVLHPDVGTGDESLMKALNNARDRLR